MREIVYGSQAVYANGRSRRRPADKRAVAASSAGHRARSPTRRSESPGPAAGLRTAARLGRRDLIAILERNGRESVVECCWLDSGRRLHTHRAANDLPVGWL